jgi:hypothetical protein
MHLNNREVQLMKLIINFFTIQNIFKSLPTSLCQREETSLIQAKLVPHFNKGGLGGICLFMCYISSMIESSLFFSLQTSCYENN